MTETEEHTFTGKESWTEARERWGEWTPRQRIIWTLTYYR